MGNLQLCYEQSRGTLQSQSLSYIRKQSALQERPGNISAYMNNYPVDPLEGKLNLNHLYKTLNIPQCFYVLSTLLQQFYAIYKRDGNAIISSHLCTVSQLGEVGVYSESAYLSSQQLRNQLISTNFVSIISQILELVKCLSSERQWLQNSQCAYFHEKIIKTIYRFHQNDEVLYQELMTETYHFMEFHEIKCNLLAALIRYHAPVPEERFLQRKKHKRYDSESIESFARKETEFAKQAREQLSKTVLTKNDNSTKFDSHTHSRQKNQLNTVYCHKVVRTEGESFYQNANQTHQDCMREEELREHSAKVRPNDYPSKNFISSQYSMNITSISNKEPQSKVRFKKITHNLKYDQSDQIQNSLKRNITTGDLRLKKHGNPHTKSVLQDLARSVEVRDVPSSKSFIF